MALFRGRAGETKDARQGQQFHDVFLEEVVLLEPHAVQTLRQAEVVLLQQELCKVASYLEV